MSSFNNESFTKDNIQNSPENPENAFPNIRIDFGNSGYSVLDDKSEEELAPAEAPHVESPQRTSLFLFQNELGVDVCLPQKPKASFDLDTLSTAIEHFRRERSHSVSLGAPIARPGNASPKPADATLRPEGGSFPLHVRKVSSYFSSNKENKLSLNAVKEESATPSKTDDWPESQWQHPREGTYKPQIGHSQSMSALADGDYRFLLYTTAHGVLRAQSLDELDDEIQRAGVPPLYKANASIMASLASEANVTLSDVLKIEMQRGSWFWMDVVDPSEMEMQLFMQIFSIHPLTSEDILVPDTREKCESFPHYYYVNMRTFQSDPSAADFLQPCNVNILVMRDSVLLSFHKEPVLHVSRVLKRMEQLMLYGLKITPGWLNYALLDDIVDSFAPLLQNVELEVDSIDDLVLILTESEKTDMLRRIARERKKVMALLRLLTNKPDVVRTLIKRRTDKGLILPVEDTGDEQRFSQVQIDAGMNSRPRGFNTFTGAAGRDLLSSKTATDLKEELSARSGSNTLLSGSFMAPTTLSSSTTEFSYYLGDIQDNLITMLINLTNYEKTLSRSHSNYLAQISIELTQASNQTNDHVMKMSLLGSIFLPMNVICGLFGMNVTVPFEATGSTLPFFGIIIFMFVLAGFAYYWLKQSALLAMGESTGKLKPSAIDHELAGEKTSR